MSPSPAEPAAPMVLEVFVSLLFLGGLLAWGGILLQGLTQQAHMVAGLRRRLDWLAWRPVPPALPAQLLAVLALGLLLSSLMAWCIPGYLAWMQDHRVAGMLVSNLIFWLPPLVVVFFSFHRMGLPMGRAFALSPDRFPKALITALGAYALLLPPMSFTVHVIQWLRARLGQDGSLQPIFNELAEIYGPASWMLMACMVIFLAPLAEEIVFRGVLLPWLAARYGVTVGLLTSSLLFALIHLHLDSMLPLFLLALGLGVVFAWTRSLLSCIALHAVFNAFSLVHFLFSSPPPAG